MRLPIDTQAMGFIAAGPAEPVLDYDTRRPKTDVNGEPIFALKVMAMAGGQVEVLAVKVPGEPKGVVSGIQVRLVGLSALPYEMKDRSGVSFSAERVEVVRPDGRSETKAGS
jgi:hypothetical protein